MGDSRTQLFEKHSFVKSLIVHILLQRTLVFGLEHLHSTQQRLPRKVFIH